MTSGNRGGQGHHGGQSRQGGHGADGTHGARTPRPGDHAGEAESGRPRHTHDADDHECWMKLAIEEAERAITAKQSPFGSVIVRAGEVLAASHNEVWRTMDPTAHAEVVAIRAAATTIGSIDLSGCVLYSTCEPCPMCACAIHWAKLDAVCYGAEILDAETAGFTELAVPIDELYRRGGSPVRVLPRAMRTECAELFAKWRSTPGVRGY